MPDLPSAIPSAQLEESFLRVVDVERKVPAALDALGPVCDRDVVVLDGGSGNLARGLATMGARTRSLAFEPDIDAAMAAVSELPLRCADVVVIPWSEFATPESPLIDFAERLLRPGGRLLLIHDYGRDEVWSLRPELQDRQVDWSHRGGPFLGCGFRVRVIHCWWTFESPEQAREMLEAAFGPAGLELFGRMKRQRLEYQVAIYHRTAAALEVIGEPRALPQLLAMSSGRELPELVAE
jgi:hypothetical protein